MSDVSDRYVAQSATHFPPLPLLIIQRPDSDLRTLFEEFGSVESVQVIVDRDTGRSKGFAVVEMSGDQEGRASINALNGKEVDGRTITVNEARPREDRGGRSGAGGRGGSGGGRRY